MPHPPNSPFRNLVNAQVEMLQRGLPLEAFDRFFAADGIMYANDIVFAKDAPEARHKQEPYIQAAKSINGQIEDLLIADAYDICVFRNKTTFTTKDGSGHQIDGLCWQKWRAGKISEERYYDGDKMRALISDGILLQPEMFNT